MFLFFSVLLLLLFCFFLLYHLQWGNLCDRSSDPGGAFFRFSSAHSSWMQHKFKTLLQICYWRMPPSHIHTPSLPSERIIPLPLLSRAAVSLENVFVCFSGLLFILVTSRDSESRRRGAVNYLFPPSFCCFLACLLVFVYWKGSYLILLTEPSAICARLLC